MAFDYFYGAEREHFRYYQMPAVMLEDGHYQRLSANAKLLYAVLLNLVSLSQANDWIESGTNRIYIVCPQKEIAYRLGCSLRSAGKTVKELEEFGLLERKKQGQGRPELLFVKNFASGDIEEEIKGYDGQEAYRREGEYGSDRYGEKERQEGYSDVQKQDSWDSENDNIVQERYFGMGGGGEPFSEMQKLPVRTRKNCTSRRAGTSHQDAQKLPVRIRKNCMPRSAETACQDTQELHANYLYGNKTDSINNQSIYQGEPCAVPGGMQDVAACRMLVRRQIEYDALIHDLPRDRECIDGLVELLVELCASNKETIRISGEEIDTRAVRERLQKVDMSCMKYILACLRENSGKVHNIRQYLITTMYNAPVTIRYFYQAEANHGMRGG